MEPREILEGLNNLVEFLELKGYKKEKDYKDNEYDKGTYFKIRERKLLVVYEVLDIEKTRDIRNHFLIEKGLAYCAIVYDKKIIFFRNFGEGRYFLFSERTKDNITKLDKLKKIDENFDFLFQRKDISGIFYEHFKSKRDLLVSNIKNKIKPVEKYLLSQKIFDRIFFTYFLCHKGIITFEKGGVISGENLFRILIDNGDFIDNLKNLFHRFNSIENRLLKVGDYSVKIPYLNGGLFRPDTLETDLRFSLGKNDWKGILHFLNQYHWIIEEDIETAIEDEERVLTPEILGHVYERSVVEWEKVGFIKEAEEAAKQKSERKKKGVYYTPEEITSFIAEKTIYPQILVQFDGRFSDIDDLIEKGTEKDIENALGIISKLKILDPACGSGAFLIKASELLFQLKVRVLNILRKESEYYKIKLNTITDNIYGVDILEGAVEITKLRLWLWLVSEYREGSEIHSLPNIEYNIRVGNSLIGWADEKLDQISLKTPLTKEVSGIFLGLIAYSSNSERKIFQKARELLSKFNLEDYITAYTLLYQIYRKTHGLKAENLKGILEKIKTAIYESINPPFLDYLNRKIKPDFRKRKPIKLPITLEQYTSALPFHWRIDFGQIMDDGGFDIVIGNPPYIQKNAFCDYEKKILQKLQPQNSSNMNIAAVFMERSYSLLKDQSYLGMIVPKSLTFSKSWLNDRERILECLKNLADVSRAWKEVLLEQVIYVIKKGEKSFSYEGVLFRDGWKESVIIDKKLCSKYGILLSSVSEEEIKLADKIASSTQQMGEFTRTFNGVPYQSILREKGRYPAIGGKQIDRYKILGVKGYFIEDAFDNFQEKIADFQVEKILSQRIIAHIQNPMDHIKITSTLDVVGRISVNTVSNTILTAKNHSLKKLTLLLNSKLLNWYAYLFIFNRAIRSMDFYDYYVSKIPIPNDIENQSLLDSISDYLLFLNQYYQSYEIKNGKNPNLEKMIQFFNNLADYITFELYLGNVLKTNLLSTIGKIERVDFDEWAELESQKDLSGKEKDRKSKIENEFLKNVDKTFNRLVKDSVITKEIELIKSNEWVKIICGSETR